MVIIKGKYSGHFINATGHITPDPAEVKQFATAGEAMAWFAERLAEQAGGPGRVEPTELFEAVKVAGGVVKAGAAVGMAVGPDPATQAEASDDGIINAYRMGAIGLEPPGGL